MADEKKSSANWGAIIAGGCGCLLFGIGVLVVVLYFVVIKATEAPETAVKEFLAAAGSGDVEGAHDYFSSALKEVQPLEDFRAVVEQNPHLFKITETTWLRARGQREDVQEPGQFLHRARGVGEIPA